MPDDNLATIAWLHDHNFGGEIFRRITAERVRAVLFPDPLPPNLYLRTQADGPIRVGRYEEQAKWARLLTPRPAPSNIFTELLYDEDPPEPYTEVQWVGEKNN